MFRTEAAVRSAAGGLRVVQGREDGALDNACDQGRAQDIAVGVFQDLGWGQVGRSGSRVLLAPPPLPLDFGPSHLSASGQ